MSEYSSAIALAQRLIKKKGQVVTWRQSLTVVDSAQPWKEQPSQVSEKKPYVCFVATADKEWRKILAYLKGSEVATGKLAGLMGAQAFTPALKDVVIRSFAGRDKTLTLTSVDAFAPAEEAVFWILEFSES